MNYFKQGSFYYGRRQDGKYIQVATFNGLSNPSISVVSESVALDTIDTNDKLGNNNEPITSKEFKHVFAKAILDITMMDSIEMTEMKHDELNESDVQKS